MDNLKEACQNCMCSWVGGRVAGAHHEGVSVGFPGREASLRCKEVSVDAREDASNMTYMSSEPSRAAFSSISSLESIVGDVPQRCCCMTRDA